MAILIGKGVRAGAASGGRPLVRARAAGWPRVVATPPNLAPLGRVAAGGGRARGTVAILGQGGSGR